MVYLSALKQRLRDALEFTFLKIPPIGSDLVMPVHQLPFFLQPKAGEQFLTLADLTHLCETFASNRMIYEAWVSSALDNVYAAATALSPEDSRRLISYFKACHDITDETDLAEAAGEAIQEAREALYG